MSSQALMVISRFICFHSFTNLSIKWFNETLDIPTEENKNYFNSDNSQKIIRGIKNYDSVTFLFVPNKTDRTSMLANDRQRWHQKAPPKSGSIILSYHVQFYIFLSIIWSIKELSSFSQCHVSGNENFSSKSLKRGREKDESDHIYIYPCLLSRVHTKTYASYKNEIFLPIVQRFLLFARLEFRRIDIIK